MYGLSRTKVFDCLRCLFREGGGSEMKLVTFSTRYLLVFLNVIFWVGVAAEAQQPLPTPAVNASKLPNPADKTPKPDAVGELPPAHSLLHVPGSSDSKPASPATKLFSESIDTPFHSEYEHNKPQYDLWDALPVAAYSSGTWLERGFWYAEADALILNRVYSRDSQIFGFDESIFTKRYLWLREGHPGADGGVRFTLGRFLFRDQENRDHAAEFTVASAGDWTQHNVVTSKEAHGLFVNPFLSLGNPDFDGASEMSVRYSSRFNSFEMNYRVKNRMRKDQMVLKPDGEWYRRASPSLTREYLIGLRFFDLSERFDWQAEEILLAPNPVADGEYLITTHNNLFGFQMGTGHAFDTGRWSLSALAKGGVFVNDATAHQRLTFTPKRDPNVNFDYRQSEDELSFVGEFALRGRWHLRPNLSLRAAYEILLVTSLALAPHQVTFIPTASTFATTGESLYQGASFGLEGYW